MHAELLLGRERRRRWSLSEKLEILAAGDEPGARVSEVAARYGAKRQQIYQWRRERREGRLGGAQADGFCAPGFLEVTADVGLSNKPAVTADLIEITLLGGRVLKAPATLEPAVLAGLIRAAEVA